MCVIVSKCSSLTLIIKCLLKIKLDNYLDLLNRLQLSFSLQKSFTIVAIFIPNYLH